MPTVLILQDMARLARYFPPASTRFARIWEEDLAAAARNQVASIVTNTHVIRAATVHDWKRRYPGLRSVSLAFTGHDGVDKAACRKAGLALFYVPDYSAEEVAELSIALGLALARKVVQGHNALRAGTWDATVFPSGSLIGARVGVVGMGKIGRLAARKWQGIGCEVLYWNRSTPQGVSRKARRVRTLEQLLREVDVVDVHLALNEDTRHILDRHRLARLQPTAFLINTARAALVDTRALVAMLKAHTLGGVGLDVYDLEPGRDANACRRDPILAHLRHLPNVVALPHLGWKTPRAMVRLCAHAFRNATRDPVRDRSPFRLV